MSSANRPAFAFPLFGVQAAGRRHAGQSGDSIQEAQNLSSPRNSSRSGFPNFTKVKPSEGLI